MDFDSDVSPAYSKISNQDILDEVTDCENQDPDEEENYDNVAMDEAIVTPKIEDVRNAINVLESIFSGFGEDIVNSLSRVNRSVDKEEICGTQHAFQ